jgi:hypothetical protein
MTSTLLNRVCFCVQIVYAAEPHMLLCTDNEIVIMLELALPSKMIQRGSESNANKVLAQEGNCSVNLASQGHCAGVFIGV